MKKGFCGLLEKKGVIIACAASPGELANCYNGQVNDRHYLVANDYTVGGVFTKNFLLNLFKECSNLNPSWLDMIRAAKKDTVAESKSSEYHLFDKKHDQLFHTPVYHVFVGEKRKSTHTYLKLLFSGKDYKNIAVDANSEVENNIDMKSIFLMLSDLILD